MTTDNTYRRVLPLRRSLPFSELHLYPAPTTTNPRRRYWLWQKWHHSTDRVVKAARSRRSYENRRFTTKGGQNLTRRTNGARTRKRSDKKLFRVVNAFAACLETLEPWEQQAWINWLQAKYRRSTVSHVKAYHRLQPWLINLDMIGARRLYAGLYPTGKWRDPCVVKCTACKYTETAPTWTAAAKLAGAHDWKHDQGDMTKAVRMKRTTIARLAVILAAVILAACDINLDVDSPTAPAAPGGGTTITNTNTNTNNIDRSDTTPATTTPPNEPPIGAALPLPSYGEQVTRAVAEQNPSLLRNSCQDTDGDPAWRFLDLLIRTLRAQDQRWGYLCKDASCLTFGRDVITYRATNADTGIWIVDVIRNHCPGPNDTVQFRYGILPFETGRRWAPTRTAGVFP